MTTLTDKDKASVVPEVISEAPWHKAKVDALIARVFGPGRLVKTAERLRDGSYPLIELCFVAERRADEGAEVVGAVRMWPVSVQSEDGKVSSTLAFLGPIAVDSTLQGEGIGKALMQAALDAADLRGYEAVILVGSHSYFQPFGFERAEGLSLPGPVDPKRLLIRTKVAQPLGRVEIAPQEPGHGKA